MYAFYKKKDIFVRNPNIILCNSEKVYIITSNDSLAGDSHLTDKL